MTDLLLELFSEEIPARMQAQAEKDLARLITGQLDEAGFKAEEVQTYSTPRRLVLRATGLPLQQEDRTEERKGPKVGAPDKAIEGFLRSVGMSKDQLETRSDKKGEFYVARIESKGRPTPEIIAEIVPAVVQNFPWPKSMRWGSGSLRWVRPLHSILCLFDGKVVPFEVDNIKSGNTTKGHRFLAPAEFSVSGWDDYLPKLKDAHVVLDPKERRDLIYAQAKEKASADGFELVEDQRLLEEVAGLVEWPTVLTGAIPEKLVQPVAEGGLPPEVLQTAMRVHQKYFSLKNPQTDLLAPKFAVVSNMVAPDGGEAIVAGNEKVLQARLSDAEFFWDQDRKEPLHTRTESLKNIVFHADIGSLYEKVERTEKLAVWFANLFGTDEAAVRRAAQLAKADLTTDMVYEFPELQGLMGRYYATHDGEPAEVAEAIEQHYAPVGPSDDCPHAPVAISVALADKIDTLVQFFAIGQPPTGSKDPFALRRAALGAIRITLENDLRFKLSEAFGALRDDWGDLLPFFADRLKVQQRDLGVRHDLIDAVFALPDQDDLVLLVRRVDALAAFLKTPNGENLLAGYKRAANILRIEEKKDEQAYEGAPDSALFQQDEEKALHDAITKAIGKMDAAIGGERFEEAMNAAAELREPVDAFFNEVKVNAEDSGVRENRLRMLSLIRNALGRIADFSKIEG